MGYFFAKFMKLSPYMFSEKDPITGYGQLLLGQCNISIYYASAGSAILCHAVFFLRIAEFNIDTL